MAKAKLTGKKKGLKRGDGPTARKDSRAGALVRSKRPSAGSGGNGARHGGAAGSAAAAAILAAAARLFADKGYDAASVREIAAAAGVAKPTVYYYYHSKEGLFEALLAASVSSLCGRLEEINARAAAYDAHECVEDAVYAGFLFAREHKDLNRFIHGQVFSPMKRPERQIIEKSFLQVTEAFRDVLRRAARARLLDETAIEAAELSLRGTLLAHIVQHLQGRMDLTMELARRIVEGFFHGYGKRPERGPNGATMKKSIGYVAAVAVYALLVGFVALLVKWPSRDDSQQTEPPEPSTNVVVSVVELTTMPDVILLPASVEPEKSVTVAAEVAGAVEWLGVEEGQSVREGDEIARIDKRTLSAALDQAKANYDLAKSEYDRADTLFKLNTMSKEQFDSFKLKLDVNKALTELAQVEFDKGTVVSSVSGVLNKRYVERGEYVKPGDPVAEIVRVDKVKVVVDVPEKDIVYIVPGGFMGIVLDESLVSGEADLDAAGSFEETIRQAIGDRKMVIGKVGYRSVVADQKTRTYRVEIDVDNPGQTLLPGMIVRTPLLRRVIKDAVAAPLFAVVPRDGRAVVYVENDSRAHERTVTLGVTDGRRIEILEGLSAGDKLIIDGQRQVKDGALVKVVEGQGTKG